MMFVACVKYVRCDKCDTHDIVTHCDTMWHYGTKMFKNAQHLKCENRQIEEWNQTSFNLLNHQMMTEGTVGAPTCFLWGALQYFTPPGGIALGVFSNAFLLYTQTCT
jgi:hypothetical protein